MVKSKSLVKMKKRSHELEYTPGATYQKLWQVGILYCFILLLEKRSLLQIPYHSGMST